MIGCKLFRRKPGDEMRKPSAPDIPLAGDLPERNRRARGKNEKPSKGPNMLLCLRVTKGCSCERGPDR